MTKQTVLPILGFLTACLIILMNLLVLIITRLNKYTAVWDTTISLILPTLIIGTFLIIRYLLVERSGLKEFNIVISLLILIKAIGLVLGGILRLSVINSNTLVIPIVLGGLFLIGVYLWFFIKLSYLSSHEVYAYSFLNYYAITFLLFMLLGALPELINAFRHKDSMILGYILQICNIIPYLFLSIYFYKNLRIPQQTT
jgi:hypothetical protein